MENKFKYDNLGTETQYVEYTHQRRCNCNVFPNPDEFLNKLFEFIFLQLPVICWIDSDNRKYFSDTARQETFVNIERKGNEIQKWTAKIPICPGGWDRLDVTMDGDELRIVKHCDNKGKDTELIKIPLMLYRLLNTDNTDNID